MLLKKIIFLEELTETILDTVTNILIAQTNVWQNV